MTNPALPAALAVFDAINERDLSRLDELVTDDFVDHGSPFPLPPGPSGYRQILGFVTGVLQVRYQIEDVIETPDRVVLRAGVFRGFRGIRARGQCNQEGREDLAGQGVLSKFEVRARVGGCSHGRTVH